MDAKGIGRAFAATLIASASLLVVSAGAAQASVAQGPITIQACGPSAVAETQFQACADGYYKFEYRDFYQPSPSVTCYKFDAYVRGGTDWQFAGPREACTG